MSKRVKPMPAASSDWDKAFDHSLFPREKSERGSSRPAPSPMMRIAGPNRGSEAMRDGSDAVSDWPLLNALLNTASGATWVSLHHGGGVGMGFSQHAGMVIVCDGTDEAAARIARVLHNDPATGVMRHADAGYDIAVECAVEEGLNLPMVAATQEKR